MSVFRLALPILWWRSASGVRLQDLGDLEQDLEHSGSAAAGLGAHQVSAGADGDGQHLGRVRLAHFTQAQLDAGQLPFMPKTQGGPIRDTVHKGFIRGCIGQYALEREHYLLSEGVDWSSMPDQGNGNISEALEAYYEAEDAAGGKKNGAKDERNLVHRLGLHLEQAEEFCEDEVNQPGDAVVKECMKGFARENRTRTRSWIFRRGGGEKAIEHNALLVSQIDERFELRHNWHLVRISTDSFTKSASGAAELSKRLDAALRDNEDNFKASGFSFTDTQRHCMRLHEEETTRTDEIYIARVASELGSPRRAKAVDGDCLEQELHCPESTSPRKTRRYRHGRAAAFFGLTLWPSYAAVPWIGYQIGGPSLSVFLTVVPLPINTVMILPIAGIIGLPWLGDCGCDLNPCEWNPEQRVCTLTTYNSSSNEFQWLPYPGTKCVPAAEFDEAAPECQMIACSLEDFQPPLQGDQGKFGKIGVHQGAGGIDGAFNCLSDTGDRHGEWGIKEVLTYNQYNMSGDRVPNTPEDRNGFYRILGATQPW